MKNWLQILLFALLLAAIVFCGFYVCNRYLMRPITGPVNYHHWIHGQLNITADQERRLEPIEDKFRLRKDKLVAEIHAAHQELSEALKQDKGDSARVKAAMGRIQGVQGELQQAVLDHVFDMRTVLTSEQYERLIQLTARALHDPPEPW